MRSDPLLKHFYRLRSEILKVGSTGTAVSTYISSFSPARDLRKFGPPPTGATSFFIGGRLGGTGWEVRRADGSVERYYVILPGEIGTVRVHLDRAPRSHLGRSLNDTTIEALSEKYLEYLESLVASARRKFHPDG